MSDFTGEKITVSGVSGEYDKFSVDGSLIRYWCDYCTQEPSVAPGVVAVILHHDACLSDHLEKLNQKEASKLVK